MRQLILFRHARAKKHAETRNDHDRDATLEGRTEALSVARSLLKAGVAPDRALISSAKRCTDTWDAIASCFPETSAQYCPELYLASEREILSLAQKSAASAVMIIGHNPGLKLLALTLSGNANRGAFEEAFRFPPAAAALFTSEPQSQQWIPAGLFLP